MKAQQAPKAILVIIVLIASISSDALCMDPGAIAGKVTVTHANEPAIGFTVEAVDSAQNVIVSAVSDNDGLFELSGIAAAQVYVRIPQQYGYATAYYADAGIIDNATPVTIVANDVIHLTDISITELTSTPDTDNDGIRDAEEVIFGADGYHTDPLSSDTDGDTLSDMEEVTAGIDRCYTDPTNGDTDSDTVDDASDPLPVHAYIDISVTRGVLAGESTSVVAKIRDLYHNDVTKDGIEFSLSSSGNAVFAGTANTGSLITGGGTPTAVVQTTGGTVSIDITSTVVEDVIITATDSAGYGLLAFSSDTPFHACSCGIPAMGGAVTDSPVQFVDDFERQVSLGFDFTFFGQTYAQADIHSNGFVTFDLFDGIPTEPFYQQMYTNDPIPDTTIPDNFIAPYWDDLDIESHGSGKITYVTQQFAAGKVFRVRWKDHGIYDSREPLNASLTFQALLFEKSNLMLFYYERLIDGTTHTANGSTATVGAENSTGSAGIQVSYNTAGITEGLAIIMSTADEPVAHFLTQTGDYDNDGLSNGDERTVSLTDPVNPDTDGDGLPDKWEYDHGLSPLSADGVHGANGDFDNDGLLNHAELTYSTNPTDSDFDNDGLTDGDEVFVYLTNPNEYDTDNDSLSDGEEINYGSDGFRTDPLLNDSDNDGISDSTDPIPVYARLVIVEAPDTFIGNPVPAAVKFQIWSMDGDLLTAVDSMVFDVHVSGSAFFAEPALKGSIIDGAGTNSARVQAAEGEVHLMVRNDTEEEVFFCASDPFDSGVQFPLSDAGYASIPYNFVDISSPQHLVPLTGDDVSADISLPTGFFFSFFGTLYSQFNTLKVSSNGYITFSPNATAVSNKTIPFHGINDPDAYIAPFWDDLIITSDALYTAVLGHAPAHRFVVQWNNVGRAAAPALPLTFQIVLHELDSRIEFHYGALSNTGTSATIGIENDSGTDGVLIGYNSGSLSPSTGYMLFDGDKPSMRFINGDYDGDGLDDLAEIALGTNPANRDSDGDGLEDNDELTVHNTDPTEADIDNDGLNDREEIFDYGTDPFDDDSDDDTFTDAQELIAGTDPNDSDSFFHVTGISVDPFTGTVTITWSSIPGKTYRIWAGNGSLGNDSVWITDVVATGTQSSCTDQGDTDKGIPHPHNESKRSYHVTIE